MFLLRDYDQMILDEFYRFWVDFVQNFAWIL